MKKFEINGIHMSLLTLAEVERLKLINDSSLKRIQDNVYLYVTLTVGDLFKLFDIENLKEIDVLPHEWAKAHNYPEQYRWVYLKDGREGAYYYGDMHRWVGLYLIQKIIELNITELSKEKFISLPLIPWKIHLYQDL